MSLNKAEEAEMAALQRAWRVIPLQAALAGTTAMAQARCRYRLHLASSYLSNLPSATAVAAFPVNQTAPTSVRIQHAEQRHEALASGA